MTKQSEYKNDFEKYIEKEKAVIELINYIIEWEED